MSHKRKTTPKPSPKNTLFNYFNKNNEKTKENAKIQEETSIKKKGDSFITGKQLDFGELKSESDIGASK